MQHSLTLPAPSTVPSGRSASQKSTPCSTCPHDWASGGDGDGDGRGGEGAAGEGEGDGEGDGEGCGIRPSPGALNSQTEEQGAGGGSSELSACWLTTLENKFQMHMKAARGSTGKHGCGAPRYRCGISSQQRLLPKQERHVSAGSSSRRMPASAGQALQPCVVFASPLPAHWHVPGRQPAAQQGTHRHSFGKAAAQLRKKNTGLRGQGRDLGGMFGNPAAANSRPPPLLAASGAAPSLTAALIRMGGTELAPQAAASAPTTHTGKYAPSLPHTSSAIPSRVVRLSLEIWPDLGRSRVGEAWSELCKGRRRVGEERTLGGRQAVASPELARLLQVCGPFCAPTVYSWHPVQSSGLQPGGRKRRGSISAAAVGGRATAASNKSTASSDRIGGEFSGLE